MTNGSVIAMGILQAWERLGVKIVNVAERGGEVVIAITVPETSDHLDVHGNEMAGRLLIKRLKNKMKPLAPDLEITGSVRKGEHWEER